MAFKRTFGRVFGSPWYEGSGVIDIAPFTFPVSLGSFGYNIDYTYAPDNFRFQSVPILRQQSDDSRTPGEQSIDPAALWRRSADSWHLGAGQEHYDREDSSPFRFHESIGFDIWDKWHLRLLPATDRKRTSANTNLRLAVAGSRLYLTDGTAIVFTTDIDVDTPSFTTVTGGPANAPTSIISDGFNVWTAHGTDGVYKTTRNVTTTASQVTGTVDLLGFARGRVLAAAGPSVYDVTTAAYSTSPPVALPTALFTQPNSDFVWKAFAEGRKAIYMAGYSGDKSLIYRATIKADGSGLDTPIVAGELPDGEQVESLFGYLGPFLLIGVGGLHGWRFALIDETGDLNIGSRVETPLPVLAFEGQENFVWYGLGGFEYGGVVEGSGLGRMNISAFGDPDGLVPAYTSDLMAMDETNNVQSVVTFQNIQVFTVSGDGVWATHHSRFSVVDAKLRTGKITYGLSEEKVGLYSDITLQEEGLFLLGLQVSTDSGPFTSAGFRVVPGGNSTFTLGEIHGKHFELELSINTNPFGSTPATISPIDISSWLLRSQPVPSITRLWTLPLLLSDSVQDLHGNTHRVNPFDQLQDIIRIHKEKSVTLVNVNGTPYSVVMEDFNLLMHDLTAEDTGYQGFNATCIVELKDVGM